MFSNKNVANLTIQSIVNPNIIEYKQKQNTKPQNLHFILF